MGRSSRIGAVGVSSPNICRYYAHFPQFPNSLGAYARQACASLSDRSAKGDELKTYLEIAGIADLIDVEASSENADRSKPSADIFEVVLQKLNMEGQDAVAIGDTPYDAEASVKASITPIGVLSGGFTESSLRQAGCVAVYAGPAALFAGFAQSVIVTR